MAKLDCAGGAWWNPGGLGVAGPATVLDGPARPIDRPAPADLFTSSAASPRIHQKRLGAPDAKRPGAMNEPSPFSPREFLKAQRPERFSDSVSEGQPVLDRTLLEYHLDTLTNRSQETDFQNFARHLAEKEVCPNLLPQTGPTGGGDSKVDSETYPVADDLSLAWYVGTGREAASERWAFAIREAGDSSRNYFISRFLRHNIP